MLTGVGIEYNSVIVTAQSNKIKKTKKTKKTLAKFAGIRTRSRALIVHKNSSIFTEGLVCCYKKFLIIRGNMRLFHKYLKVPHTHFRQVNFVLDPQRGGPDDVTHDAICSITSSSSAFRGFLFTQIPSHRPVLSEKCL